MPSRVNKVSIISDLMRVADILGHTPLTTEYERLGKYSTITVRSNYGSWKGALAAANLTPSKNSRNTWTDQELSNELKRVADIIGHSPTWTDLQKHSRISSDTLNRRFGRETYIKNPEVHLTPTWSVDNILPEDGAWIAGLVTGEGCFVIRKSYTCFSVALRADDASILEFIRQHMDISSVVRVYSNQYRRDKGQKAGDEARLTSNNRTVAALRIIPFFQRFQLHGRKELDFRLYSEAVHIMYNRQLNGLHHTRIPSEEKERLHELMLSLKSLRRDPTSFL